MAHLDRSELSHGYQHGFRQRRSFVPQLPSTLEDWSRMVENGDLVDDVDLDFSKAFDSVSHKQLLRKLKTLGVTGRLLNWIIPLLSGRRQRVIVNGSMSDWVDVTSGVPQVFCTRTSNICAMRQRFACCSAMQYQTVRR